MSLKSDRTEGPCCEIQGTEWLMSPDTWSPCSSSPWLPTKLAHSTIQEVFVHPYGLHRSKCAVICFMTQHCVCSELARLPHLTSQSHCLRGLLPQVTSEQLLWDLQLLQHSSWGWKLQDSTYWWLDMSPRATQLLCVTNLCLSWGDRHWGLQCGVSCRKSLQQWKAEAHVSCSCSNLDMKY